LAPFLKGGGKNRRKTKATMNFRVDHEEKNHKFSGIEINDYEVEKKSSDFPLNRSLIQL
jgi:hypothetical protein